MATAKDILRLTQTEAVVKVYGTADNEVINLAQDLTADSEDAIEVEETPVGQMVNIIGISWNGAGAHLITITRDSDVLYTLGGNGSIDLDGQEMVPDTTKNLDNITVTISGAAAQCLLRLRKVEGWIPKFTPEQDGAYTTYDIPE